MSVVHRLRGYHKDTGHLAVVFDVSPDLLAVIGAALPEARYDPDLIDPHALTPEQTARVKHATGFAIDADCFDYFMEADEDWRAVAEIRDMLHAEV